MKKILLIEDNPSIRENTGEILSLANYIVFTAQNGKVGVELALKEKPDLVLCDIMMPVLDGYGVLYLLQNNVETRSIPFIFLSAKNDDAALRKGMELGTDDYITKPYAETELLKAIERRLAMVDLIKQDILLAGLEEENDLIGKSTEREILQLFAENRNVNKYKRKQVIYNEGNHPGKLYYIKKGKVKTYKINEDGKELTVGLYNEGDFLGYIALLEGTTYKEMCQAMEDTELAVIPREEFSELIKKNAEIVKLFFSMLANKIADDEQHMLGLAYNSLRKKVAEALIILYKKYKTPINIGRENLASIAGTAKESLIRTLGDFKSEKLIDIKGGIIIILNEKKLEKLIG